MMPGPSSALSRGACGYHLKQEPKVFSLLISQYPATVPTDRTKQEDHRQGSLEYVVGRLSVQVPLLSLPMWRLRHVSYCTYGRVGAWIQAVCTAFTLGSSLDCVWWSDFSPCWWAPQMSVSSEFCLFTTYFSFGFSGTPLFRPSLIL